MSRFARIVEDPEYDEDFDELEDSEGWFEIDAEVSRKVFDKIVEELSPFETVNS